MQTVSLCPEVVKVELVHLFSSMLDALFQEASSEASPRELEEKTWETVLLAGNTTFSALLSHRARCASEQDIKYRELPSERVLRRLDKDYWATMTSTFGPVTFAWSAYRELRENGASVTRNPAKDELFPAFKTCRSTPLCLQWETRLGSDHPFRTAQKALTYFTHGAVHLEDTTIARHMVRVGLLVTRDDMYRTPDQIREILHTKATCDRKTDRPLLYVSSDAHALRRYVDDTWAAQWKMTNGIRLWCEDNKTGQIIHLGGEFTWGDCHEVRDIFLDLIHRGVLPADGDYGEEVHAQLVWLSDGMTWFKDHLQPLFPGLVVILDAFHLLQAVAAYIALCCLPKSPKARRWLDEVTECVLGSCPRRTPSGRRKGHTKRKGARDPRHTHEREVSRPQDLAAKSPTLIALIFQEVAPSEKAQEVRHGLLNYIQSDPQRIAYTTYLSRGYQIGSGAMESLHRTASQLRLKLPGASWLPHTSQAIFNIRMMRMTGNEEQFWNQPDLEARFAALELPE